MERKTPNMNSQTLQNNISNSQSIPQQNILNLDENNFFRCYYLNEVSLISYNLCGFCPSLIACACLYINLKSNIRLFKGYNEEKLFEFIIKCVNKNRRS